MKEFYYDVTRLGIVFLGWDPYTPTAQRLVAAVNTPEFKVYATGNGFQSFPALYCSGYCRPVPSVEVSDDISEEEAGIFVLKKVLKTKEEKIAAS